MWQIEARAYESERERRAESGVWTREQLVTVALLILTVLLVMG